MKKKLNCVLLIDDDKGTNFINQMIIKKSGITDNIQTVLNTTEYARYRFGISDEFKKGKQVDYVLGEWNEAEKTALPDRLLVASEIIKSFGIVGIENTMSNYNGK